MSITSGGRVDPIERNKETDRTKNKLTTYLIKAVNCFSCDVNNKKTNIWGNGHINNNVSNNDNNNDKSRNNGCYKTNNNDKGNHKNNDNNSNISGNSLFTLNIFDDYNNNGSYDSKSNNNK